MAALRSLNLNHCPSLENLSPNIGHLQKLNSRLLHIYIYIYIYMYWKRLIYELKFCPAILSVGVFTNMKFELNPYNAKLFVD